MSTLRKSIRYAGVAALVLLILFVLNFHSVSPVNGLGEDPSPTSFDNPDIQKFNADELHALVAPIALYPDALLAQALPASVYPAQVVDAYRFTQEGGNANEPPTDATWDASVIALLHYPTVLKKMNDDLKWTEQLGVAVTYQMDDVSQAIQDVRREAQSVGNLVSNDNEIVDTSDDMIQIEPANPEVMYVPDYDPNVVYYQQVSDPFIWGTGYSYGMWLGNSWDWRHHRIWRNNDWRNGGWHRSTRSEWNAPRSSVPSWYSRSGRGSSGASRVSPRGVAPRSSTRSSGATSTPGAGRTPRAQSSPQVIAPDSSIHIERSPRTISPDPSIHIQRSPQGTPRTSSRSFDNEDMRNRGQQSILESQRGQFSRRNTTIQAPAATPHVEHIAPHVERAPATPHVSAPQHVAPSLHESRPSDRGTAVRESSRGASSRGGGGGGAPAHVAAPPHVAAPAPAGGGGGPGGKHH